MWMLVFITAITGIGFNDKVWLPFSIQPAMGALIFYHAGRLMREKKVLEEPVTAMPVGILVMGAVMWLVTIFYANLGMHANSYHSLVSFLGAIAATYFITQFSKWLYRVPALGVFLNWCGRNSIYIYCLHAIDRINHRSDQTCGSYGFPTALHQGSAVVCCDPAVLYPSRGSAFCCGKNHCAGVHTGTEEKEEKRAGTAEVQTAADDETAPERRDTAQGKKITGGKRC